MIQLASISQWDHMAVKEAGCLTESGFRSGDGLGSRSVFWKRRDRPPWILGKWMGRVNNEPVAMEFRDDGRLAYVVLKPDGTTQITRMTYRIEGDELVTDQPSRPREERSTFRVERNLLTIKFEDKETRFQRET